MPSKILCLTRGGQASYANQDGAVAIAKDRNQELVFLYISNMEFLDLTSGPILVDVQHELDEMGEFLLVMAQERARAAGIEAGSIVCQGDFRGALKEVLEDDSYNVVILGSPAEETGVVKTDYLDELCHEICEEFNLEVILLHDGEIVKTYYQDGPDNQS